MEQTIDIHNLDECQMHYAEWKKTASESIHSIIPFLKRQIYIDGEKFSGSLPGLVAMCIMTLQEFERVFWCDVTLLCAGFENGYVNPYICYNS